MRRSGAGALTLGLAAALTACGPSGETAVVRVAVAANFSDVHERLARRFTERTGTPVRASVGSTGQLYAQILNGAPFDVFLAADAERPRLLQEAGRVAAGERFTYARGRLALLSSRSDVQLSGTLAGEAPAALLDPRVRRIAVADPRTAPYGAAAVQALEALGLRSRVEARLVLGESVSQAHQFVASGAAELGFVALPQARRAPSGRVWVVPESLHAPLWQDAVLLRHDGAPPAAAAEAYFAFLRSAEARGIVEAAGYHTGDDAGGTP